jgi:hypothetical protein
MRKKRLFTNKHSKVRRQRDPLPWKYCLLSVVCGLILVSGFFFAAKQHFMAVDFGMRNADLRQRISKIKDEKRRLILTRARASSPGRIAKAAKKIGFSSGSRAVIAARRTKDRSGSAVEAGKPVYTYSTYDNVDDAAKNAVAAKETSARDKRRNTESVKAMSKNSVASLSDADTSFAKE